MAKYVKSLKFGQNSETYIIKDAEAHTKIDLLSEQVENLNQGGGRNRN